jgi:hypothetical protein
VPSVYKITARHGPTESTCHVIAIQPVHWRTGCFLATVWAWIYRKHMSRDRYPLFCDVTTYTKKTLLQYCWPSVCCGRCLAMDLHVTICYLDQMRSLKGYIILDPPPARRPCVVTTHDRQRRILGAQFEGIRAIIKIKCRTCLQTFVSMRCYL